MGGAGGSSDSSNITIEIGKTSTYRDVNHIFSFGIGFILNEGNIPSDTLDYPCPHGYYTDIGTEQKGSEIAILGRYGLEIAKKGIFLSAIAGMSFSEEVELVQSKATGWYYEQDSSNKTYGIFGMGLHYFPKNSRISLQLDCDNRRGITGGIGIRW